MGIHNMKYFANNNQQKMRKGAKSSAKEYIASLGGSIRSIREKQNITIRKLSVLTGLTSSYISQIERNIIVPSLKSLIKIGETLKVPIISFFSNSLHDKEPITRNGQRKHIKLPNSYIEYELLSPSFNYNIEFLLVTIHPDQPEDEELVSHRGEECIYVLKGTLRVDLEDVSYMLYPGDSIHFHASMQHRLVNIGKGTVVGVIAESPPSF
jgi:transcriptional regulator with XRE-family HTH domain